ncbi:MAG TPA: hypothetical protein VFD94_01320, partial [Jatrophihabitans sp.]|nr:hypothetical protein [Jatrophihabitans sp.]
MQLGTATTDAAFDRLYRAQWHSMVRVAILLVGDVESAKDCVQDAFIGLYRRPLGPSPRTGRRCRPRRWPAAA